ncbi:hypothetical protein PVAP13_2NG258906 [Panicum virgatum]|uniref:Uncharacterized protein n=1 Tax=Panicum virgatum TaxID=38727 RepID=A0A8T0VPE7_PANVG|nr:hypothetical protein PVAP13_2NG258906 [Panicum virgatum]
MDLAGERWRPRSRAESAPNLPSGIRAARGGPARGRPARRRGLLGGEAYAGRGRVAAAAMGERSASGGGHGRAPRRGAPSSRPRTAPSPCSLAAPAKLLDVCWTAGQEGEAERRGGGSPAGPRWRRRARRSGSDSGFGAAPRRGAAAAGGPGAEGREAAEQDVCECAWKEEN